MRFDAAPYCEQDHIPEKDLRRVTHHTLRVVRIGAGFPEQVYDPMCAMIPHTVSPRICVHVDAANRSRYTPTVRQNSGVSR